MNETMESNHPKQPDIEYPCTWIYTVIGEDTRLLEEIIRTACAPNEVDITPSHSSTKGKYHSLHAKLTVDSQEMRLSIYELLSGHSAVKMVL